jgi:hypothetical protein
MMDYFKQSNIKMRQIDPDTHKGVELTDINSEDINEEIKQSQDEMSPMKGTVGRSGRRRVPVAGPMPDIDSEMDEEDSDDESFDDKHKGSDEEEAEEDGEEDLEDDIDDEKIGKEELAHLQGESKPAEKRQKKK